MSPFLDLANKTVRESCVQEYIERNVTRNLVRLQKGRGAIFEF